MKEQNDKSELLNRLNSIAVKVLLISIIMILLMIGHLTDTQLVILLQELSAVQLESEEKSGSHGLEMLESGKQ
jgi:hypothetical protein